MARLPEFSYAFQPIVDVSGREVFSYEALVRGPLNESAGAVLEAVPPHRIHEFDQRSRMKAVRIGAALGIPCRLNLNFMPGALDSRKDALSSTIDAAVEVGFPLERLMLEVTEGEVIKDSVNFAAKINEIRRLGVGIAIDDFGSGYSGLNLLADFQPDQVKLDMNLVRRIESNGPRQAIVRAVSQLCVDLGIDVIAEGVETIDEFRWFANEGIALFQGYLFARPGFQHLPEVRFPD